MIEFIKGNKITTNGANGFEILAVNKDQICCLDMLSGDFVIFYKTDHDFKLFDSKFVLKNCLKEIIEETDLDIDSKNYKHIINTMNIYIDKLI